MTIPHLGMGRNQYLQRPVSDRQYDDMICDVIMLFLTVSNDMIMHCKIHFQWSGFCQSYFEDDEEESGTADLPYIPAENSPTRQQMQSGGESGGGGGGGGGGGEKGSDSEDDPLDAFMAEVEVRPHTHTCSRA